MTKIARKKWRHDEDGVHNQAFRMALAKARKQLKAEARQEELPLTDSDIIEAILDAKEQSG